MSENNDCNVWQYRRNAEVRELSSWPEEMHRIALVVEYQGAAFQGFQRQASAKKTVQGDLESALSNIANEPITLACAGRTDAGVHATQQVIHFDTLAQRPSKAWREGVNTKLPDAIRVVHAQAVSPSFHARFSARARTYRYVLHSSSVRSAHLVEQVSWTKYQLDIASALLAQNNYDDALKMLEEIIDNDVAGFNEKNRAEELLAYTKHKMGI